MSARSPDVSLVFAQQSLTFGTLCVISCIAHTRMRMPSVLPPLVLGRSHMAPFFTEFPFPKSLFEKFVRENDGEQQRL